MCEFDGPPPRHRRAPNERANLPLLPRHVAAVFLLLLLHQSSERRERHRPTDSEPYCACGSVAVSDASPGIFSAGFLPRFDAILDTSGFQLPALLLPSQALELSMTSPLGEGRRSKQKTGGAAAHALGGSAALLSLPQWGPPAPTFRGLRLPAELHFFVLQAGVPADFPEARLTFPDRGLVPDESAVEFRTDGERRALRSAAVTAPREKDRASLSAWMTGRGSPYALEVFSSVASVRPIPGILRHSPTNVDTAEGACDASAYGGNLETNVVRHRTPRDSHLPAVRLELAERRAPFSVATGERRGEGLWMSPHAVLPVAHEQRRKKYLRRVPDAHDDAGMARRALSESDGFFHIVLGSRASASGSRVARHRTEPMASSFNSAGYQSDSSREMRQYLWRKEAGKRPAAERHPQQDALARMQAPRSGPASSDTDTKTRDTAPEGRRSVIAGSLNLLRALWNLARTTAHAFGDLLAVIITELAHYTTVNSALLSDADYVSGWPRPESGLSYVSSTRPGTILGQAAVSEVMLWGGMS
ncbi:hypothetical protein BESB_067820 [Besnoitia besnoiti]|uniref:Uncharacterized protein n=1 Tax=Besnoitia besnoiti TaxID=94643 RepID=A0A2A9MA23_BESBE|nr:hypothetical protein BESB_067820 [Besnoitia besnoiti]PFH34749.1 hypothetical protein BESB_067820 [Besnoitia besnoiti]